MEAVERDYAPKDVQFFYVYKHLAHPELNGYVRPATLDERLLHIAEAKQRIGTRFNWLCDTMGDDFANAMGNAPNSEWLIDPDGMIVSRRDWSNARLLRQDLAAALGAVTPITEIEDLDLPVPTAPDIAPTNIVPRIAKPDRLRPVRTRARTNDTSRPIYAKLRAEAEDALLADTDAPQDPGVLYLRFMMDPLYNVHWDNLSEPIRVTIDAPDGIRVEPTTMRGPDVSAADGDADPREFLVTVSGAHRGKILTITAHYNACNDAEKWCVPVTHVYDVTLEPDPNAGRIIPRTGGRRPNDANRR